VDHISFGQYLDRISTSRSVYPGTQLARIVHEWRERLVVGGVGHVGRGVSVPWR
jgi:hypothetical protein